MIEGVHYVRSAKPGKPVRWYVYAWRGGPVILKADGPTKPKLGRAEVAAIAAAHEDQKAVKADMLAGVARAWQRSPEWLGLASSTRTLWGGELDLIEAKWGTLPIGLWNDYRMVAKVIAWRDSRAATPRAADQGVKVLSELLKFAKLRAMIKINVAADVPGIYRAADRAEIIWTPEDLEKAEAAAIAIERPRALDIIRLACLTGMRRADLAALTWDEVSDHAIIRTALKRSRGRRRRAVIPMHPELAKLLAELRKLPRAEGVNHVLVGARGRPWKPESITEAVIAITKAGGIAEPAVPELDQPERRKHLHDCRGTFVTHLCRAGLTDEEIANIAAWSVESVSRIRRTYVDDAAVVVALSERIRRAL
ncbi:tyrosine-type recombinase/integrase [Sphingomonas sp. SRS2]|uniref:tyrosine-type recombinase/integrase n=1 Tax=Sphingomonas sp. SRS2 TaxID=133190 RepID=UPI0006184B51|nr:site-specific integrase [Sphingomonas sp. SRS2]KKC24900.1 hypothetical protein WP12_16870 [Sphingomonas sp. SRS2]